MGTIAQVLKSPTLAGLLPETETGADGRYTATVRPWRDPETGETVSVGRGLMTPAAGTCSPACCAALRVTPE